MGRRSKRSQAAKQREEQKLQNSAEKPKQIDTTFSSRASFVGVYEDSPLKSPALSDAKKWVRREKLEFPRVAKADSSQPSSSTSSSSSEPLLRGKRGRPKSDFHQLTRKARLERLKQLEIPANVLRTPKWWGMRFCIQTFSGDIFDLEFNSIDLTAFTLFEGRPLPAEYQVIEIKSEKKLLSLIDAIKNYTSCEGNIAGMTYLEKKKVVIENQTLLRRDRVLAQVTKVTSSSLQYYALSCKVIVLDKDQKKCSPCKLLQKAIRDKTSYTHTFAEGKCHSNFAKQLGQNVELSQIPQLSPFLQTYFEHLTSRTSSTQPWSPPIIIFSIAMYCRAGTTGYDELRKYIPLPCRETLRKITSKVSSGPGINHSAIASFIQREPLSSICISFDEIYYSQGLKLIRLKDTFHVVGMTMFGNWECTEDQVDSYLFHFSEETDIRPDLRLAEETEDPPWEHQDPFQFPDLQEPHTHPEPEPELINWCSEVEALTTLQEEDHRNSKMAIHFLISSISSNTTQAIGYAECFSVTAKLLKALLFLIIKAIYQFADQFTSPYVQPPPVSTTITQSSLATVWQHFHSFAADWSTSEIQQDLLQPQSREVAPWLSERASLSPKYRARVVAISFDGSSHARSLVKNITIAKNAARYFCHPSRPAQKIFCISDIVHIFKRFRNAILKDRIFLAPNLLNVSPLFPNPETSPEIFVATFNKSLYKRLAEMDTTAILSVSRLSNSAIDLTSRTKMSFPLAKQLFAPRTILGLEAMEQKCRSEGDHTGAYLAYSAKSVSTLANKILYRTRSRWILTGQHLLTASQQLFDIWEQFREWRLRNNSFYLRLQQKHPTKTFDVPSTKIGWGFFDAQLYFDLGMTLVGLSILSSTEDAVCLRFITSDCVESFFSTIRSAVGGGGQLNAKTHRFSTRRAMLVRMHLHSYVGEMISRDQPALAALLNKKPVSESPRSLPFLINTLPDWQTYEVNSYEMPVIRYIAGWLLKSLLKHFPKNLILHELVQAKIHGLTQAENQFEEMVQRLIIFAHLLVSQHGVQLHLREDSPTIIRDYMLTICSDLIFAVVQSHPEIRFVATKITKLYVADYVRRKRAFYEQSFRNSLK